MLANIMALSSTVEDYGSLTDVEVLVTVRGALVTARKEHIAFARGR
jgi:hypothetical protein